MINKMNIWLIKVIKIQLQVEYQIKINIQFGMHVYDK